MVYTLYQGRSAYAMQQCKAEGDGKKCNLV